MAKIEKDFEAYARQRAEQLGAGLEWKRPEQLPAPAPAIPGCAASVWRRLRDDKWMDQYPKNCWVLQHKAAKLIGQKVGRAKAPLQTLIEATRIKPDQTARICSWPRRTGVWARPISNARLFPRQRCWMRTWWTASSG